LTAEKLDAGRDVLTARTLPLERRHGPRHDQIAEARDGSCRAVVVAHQPLDPVAQRHALRPWAEIAEERRDRLLLLEAQAIDPSPGPFVEEVADPPQKLAALFHRLELTRNERTDAYQIAEIADVPARPRRPEGDIEIPQAPGAVLDVGLEQVDRAAETVMALGNLVLEAAQESGKLRRREDACSRP